MDNAVELRAGGVTPRGFLALLTIAEACRDNRVGRVSRVRLAAVLGASERTASRAVSDLVSAGVVELVAKGNKGVAGGVSNTYRIVRFGPDGARDDVDGEDFGAVDNGNDGTPTCPVEPVDNFGVDGNDGTPKCPVDSVDNSGDNETGHVSTGHIGPIDGTPRVSPVPYPVKESRGYVSRERYVGAVPDVPPSKRCTIHHDATNVPACGACADARRAWEAWEADHVERLRLQALERRNAVMACGWCDDYGWAFDTDRSATNVRCNHRPALRVVGE
ncbi:hypothetical protein ACH47B_06690 [Rhodococcus sp. NPDC019627]|uniref:hypothetical protein n=1 Tax=unclassified Rhodococcus (in: high G+C Gram-positive bacteria) TaxID=192944 RepID=UPI0037A9FC73